MDTYPFKHMRPGDSVRIVGKRVQTVRMAAARYGGMSVSAGLAADCRVICNGEPDPSRMYVMTEPDEWSESIVLYGPASYDECVGVRAACEALAGQPTVLRFSSLGLGDGVFNGVDLSGTCGK